MRICQLTLLCLCHISSTLLFNLCANHSNSGCFHRYLYLQLEVEEPENEDRPPAPPQEKASLNKDHSQKPLPCLTRSNTSLGIDRVCAILQNNAHIDDNFMIYNKYQHTHKNENTV